MISANEANEALSVKIREEQKRELALFEDAVRKAIHLEENCIIAKSLHESTILALRKEGYKVKFKVGFLFLNPHWKISW